MLLRLLRVLLLLMVGRLMMRMMMVQCVAVMSAKRLVRMARTDIGSLRSRTSSCGHRCIGRTRWKDIFVRHNAERTGKLIIVRCTTLPTIPCSASSSTRWHTVLWSIARGNGLLLMLFEKRSEGCLLMSRSGGYRVTAPNIRAI
uniref:Putative secreted protein n=1 Tax=Anopheles marajoara TaxID=58244 RepID=A0A2M4C6J5_9DIPT